MKLFHKEENGKEVVYVQKNNLLYLNLLISEGMETTSIYEKMIFGNNALSSDDDWSAFIKFDAEDEVEFFRKTDAIIDYNQYKDCSIEDLKNEKNHKLLIAEETRKKTENEKDVKQKQKLLNDYKKSIYEMLEISNLIEVKEKKTELRFPDFVTV